MQIHDEHYRHTPAEIEEMRHLLVKSHTLRLEPFNWRLALFENWIFGSRYLEPVEYFTHRIHLWRDSAGELAAFLIRGTGLANLQIDCAYRDREDDIFDWAERNPLEEGGEVEAMVYDWDAQRQELLAGRGYQNLGAIEDIRLYDLAREYPPPALPPGYRFTSLAETKDEAARVDLENQVWGVLLNEAWLRGKRSAPSYSPDWDLLVESPQGRLAALCLVWLYPHNATAEIDPLGTHPDHRRRGLARLLVLESFRRMRLSGMRYAYIGCEAQDPVVRSLYASLQPVETWQGYQWVKA